MELRERKQLVNGKLPEFAEGKLLHKPTQQGLDGMITGGVNFLGQVVNSFGGVKSSSDILAESGTSVGQGSGFTYQKQNSVDSGAQMSEVSSQNTANTLNTAAAGASLGSAFGPIGAGIGGVVGGAVGFVGGLFRKNKMAERIKQAQLQATRNNNFALASAQTDFLTKDYNVNHDNTQDDLLYQAKDGKLPGFADGFDGRAKISNGEIYGHVDRFGNVLDMHRAGHGKDNNDTLTRRLGNTQDEFNRAFVVTNKGGASDYVAATGDVAGGLEIGNIMKDFRAVKQLSTGAFNYKNGLIPKFEDQKNPLIFKQENDSTDEEFDWGKFMEKVPKYIPTPTLTPVELDEKIPLGIEYPNIYRAQNARLSDNINIHKNVYKPEPKSTDNSNLYNVITSSTGILGGLSQILGARSQKLNKPDTYATNPYERQALDIYSWLNPATNRAVSAAAATEARNKYNINRMGGLSGAQKYLASVQSGIGLQKNIADIIAETQMQRNQLKSQLAGAMLNTGAANAQRRQNANQYLDEAYARSHGARTQMEQMGMHNMIAALNQYYKNFDKLNRFNRTMAYYDQDYQLRKDALNQGFYR